MTDFPDFDENIKLYEYVENLKSYLLRSCPKEYNMIMDFIKLILKGKNIEIKSIIDFKYISKNKLPSNKKCKILIENEGKKLLSKLYIDFDIKYIYKNPIIYCIKSSDNL